MAMAADEMDKSNGDTGNLDPDKSRQELLGEVSAQGGPQACQADRDQRGDLDGKRAGDPANVRTIPGIITSAAATYAGCKGVVLGPTRDIVNITHGPIGCGFYAWLTRRNQTDAGSSADGDNFMTYCFSTDMQDEDIIFGGEKKLARPSRRPTTCFNPRSSPSSPPVRWA